jgi:hypothetical protein
MDFRDISIGALGSIRSIGPLRLARTGVRVRNYAVQTILVIV